MSRKPILPLAAHVIREARVRCGINQSELAERLGVAPSAVSDWESGAKDPSVSNLYRIVAACGLELRFNPVLPTQQDELQAETDYRELARGRSPDECVREAQLVREKFALGAARRAS